MKRGRRRRSRWYAVLSLLALAFPLGWIGWNQANFNFGILEPGRIYRAGQMTPQALRRTLDQYKVRTVVNLRGPNLEESWYRGELQTTLASGATQVDLALSSCVWMSRIQLRALVRVLDTCEYPLLLHCAWGSERTGLASAVAELLNPARTLADARRQLALRFLYVPLGDGKIMGEFLDQYEGWLKQNRLQHSSAVFRRWVASGYDPPAPNREQWPYDPFPLLTVTRSGRFSTEPPAPRLDASADWPTIRR